MLARAALLREEGAPPTTWAWYLRNWASWLACRGCGGLVPELARHEEEYALTEQEVEVAEAREATQGEWVGFSKPQIQAVFRQHAAAEVARGRARAWRFF